jgi:hypothetical protein
MSECLLRNEECFLEEPEWKRVLSSMSTSSSNSPTDREPVAISLWTRMLPIPRLFRQTTLYICTSTHPDPALRDEILLQAYDTRQDLISWLREYHLFYQRYQYKITEFKLHELLAVALAMQILLQRLIVALQPLDPGSPLMEQETQGNAERIVALQDEAAAAGRPRTSILVAQKVFIAKAAIASRDDWGATLGATGRGVVPREVFQRWSDLLMRKID